MMGLSEAEPRQKPFRSEAGLQKGCAGETRKKPDSKTIEI